VADTSNIPLAVDLDGTLIRTDMMFESLARLLRRNPLALFQVLWWWLHGRPRLKQQLAARITIPPAQLPYNEDFLAWLRREKKSGRTLVLATASDITMAQPIAEHIGIFDQVLASDGRINLRSENKCRLLTEIFGDHGFDYAGNSSADFAVWRGSRAAVVVNASRSVRRKAARCTQIGPVFCDHYVPLATARNFFSELLWKSGYLMAALAGLLLASAFPKLGFAGFAWVAPALLLFAARTKSGGDAFRAGYAGGLVFWLASLYWLLLIPYAFFPVLGWLALAGYLAVFFGTWTWLMAGFDFQKSSWLGRLGWSLGGAAAWVALEMLRGWLWGGFPWSFLGVSQYQLVPLIQLASVTGVYGITFLVAWFSLSLFCAAEMIFRTPTRRHVWQAEIVLPMLVVVLCFVGGFFRMSDESIQEAGFQATVIQPCIPQSVIWHPSLDETGFEKFLAQNEAALTNSTDLLVWPESAVPEMSAENCDRISSLARRHHVWLILNGEDMTTTTQATNFYNAAFLVNPAGRLAGTYHKQKLVIFGEYVPLVRWLPFLKWFTPIVGGWTPGNRPVTFPLTGLNQWEESPTNVIFLGMPETKAAEVTHTANLSVLVCFEDTFPGVARAAAQDNLDCFVNLTNDGWFGDSSEQWQHMANAVFRAVENGVPLLRCCNNGITCLINRHGGIEQLFRDGKGSEYGQGALTVRIPLQSTDQKTVATFYNRHGDCFGWGCVATTALLGLRRLLPARAP
jgi:apolipoprotein N-acyltransferase